VRDIGMGCLASEEGHSIFRQGIEAAVSRERPLFRETVNGVTTEHAGHPYTLISPARKSWFDNSFFSGHVTSIASCTSFITHRFHLGFAEPVLWTFASAVSLTRIADQRHYTSDVLLGGLLGYAVGKLVGERSRARALAQSGGAPGSSNEHANWTDGIYISRSGSLAVIGWRSAR
jgi:membrane-associated phospholipid phosphatase